MKYLNDIAGITGLGCLGVGLWMVDMRLSLVVVGTVLMAVAYKGASH